MAERNISRPWSEEEDQLLKQGVALYGESENWKTIAAHIPGRTNKACRKRWLHSLQPNVKKTAWTPDEDELLIDLFEQVGSKWSFIARQIPGRTDDACSKRYREALDPKLKKDEWTPEEDRLLIDAYNRLGREWSLVALELSRSSLWCRNRYRLLERKMSQFSSQISTPEHAHIPQESLAPMPEYLAQPEMPSAEPQWPPYYPPESYPTFGSDDDPHRTLTYREPTPPQAIDIPDPNVAPFQPSSSSLSAALSDPPRSPAQLPPISLNNTPELVVSDIPHDSDRQPSLSPLSQCNGIPEMNDILMSQPNYSQPQFLGTPNLETSITQLPFDDTFNLSRLHDSSFFTSASPIYISGELPRTLDPLHPLQFSFWKPRSAPEIDYDNSPRSTIDNRSILNEDFSSAASTPFHVYTPLSPSSSPFINQIMDLPSLDQPSSTSLLFAPSNESQSSLLQRTRKLTSRKPKPTMKTSASTRLSSVLSLDPNLQPYACGFPACWPAGAKSSMNCFTTSGGLLDHTKEVHSEEEVVEKPYRCALPGCEKSWKSINGLQYHLQISMAHFRNALFSMYSAKQQPSSPDQIASSLSGEDGEGTDTQRKYVCPEFGCYKAYRQTSGLRYHVKNGHPKNMPAQLEVVPPALERAIPIKARKLRAKPPPQPAVT